MEVNRREALKALAAIPAVKSIEVAQVKPNDVIVIEAEGHITEQAHHSIRDLAEQVWPGHKCVVLADGLKLKIARHV